MSCIRICKPLFHVISNQLGYVHQLIHIHIHGRKRYLMIVTIEELYPTHKKLGTLNLVSVVYFRFVFDILINLYDRAIFQSFE